MIRQGEIYVAELNPVQGREQAGFRPVIVIQNNVLNRHLDTTVIVPTSGNVRAKGKLTTYFLAKGSYGLEKDSVALLFQIRTIDVSRLHKKIGALPQHEISAIQEQLKFVF